MIIIRRGYGALVAVALVLAALVMNIITNAMFDNEYYGANIWPKLGTFWLAGLMSFGLGRFLQGRPKHPNDKDWFKNESAHHLFFISPFYWGIIYFVIGVIYVGCKLARN